MNKDFIKILIIEDSDFDFELIDRKVKSMDLPFQTKRAYNERDFRNLLDEFSPDLILSDYSMPIFSGLEALKMVKTFYSSIPFIFVSGTLGEELAVECLKQGAIDYVLKDNLDKLELAMTRALGEVKEKEKRKEAEEKLRIKVEELKKVIYSTSHDLKAPIVNIEGIINLFLETKNPSIEESQSYINLIQHEVKKLDSIILNLSSINFIYEDKVEGSVINLDDLFKELKKTLSLMAGYDEIKFNLNINQKGIFFGDHRLLLSVFYNLIQNAIVFSDKNKSERAINCTINSTDSSMEVLIEDNGIGIEDKIQEKIFTMFYRGNSFSKGAGLGLFIVKTIVDKLHGVIKVESQVKTGTKIFLKIPSLSSSMEDSNEKSKIAGSN
ncbi:MAG TPA: hybrid sensor histidine kinase/response regulator [Cytophagaceae bacterium]|jgi:two-component system sensor histidine kinase/response regulator|nr:hybrid sensor histidine kinase/response regulator [Cytophagaceae bacterium]